jgi:hypothetical protein
MLPPDLNFARIVPACPLALRFLCWIRLRSQYILYSRPLRNVTTIRYRVSFRVLHRTLGDFLQSTHQSSSSPSTFQGNSSSRTRNCGLHCSPLLHHPQSTHLGLFHGFWTFRLSQEHCNIALSLISLTRCNFATYFSPHISRAPKYALISEL